MSNKSATDKDFTSRNDELRRQIARVRKEIVEEVKKFNEKRSK